MGAELADLMAKGLGELPFNILAFVVFAWTTNKNSEKQQELVMIHNEQLNKMIQSTSELAEGLAELVHATRENSETIKKVDTKIDSLEAKLQEIDKACVEIEDKVTGIKSIMVRRGED